MNSDDWALLHMFTDICNLLDIEVTQEQIQELMQTMMDKELARTQALIDN